MYLVLISPLSIVLNINKRIGYQIVRKQFPIMSAEALTIHKSQGQILKNMYYIDLRKNYRMTMLYAALSRVQNLSDLYILGNFIPLKKPSIDNPWN